MSVKKYTFLLVSTSLLLACGSTGRNSSPNYHINNMERMDKDARYPQALVAQPKSTQQAVEKAMKKDK